MALPEFKLHEPKTVKELQNLLKDHGEEAEILAGGTDLIPDLRGRHIKPNHIIDIKNIEKLNEIKYKNEELTLGATITAKQLQKHKHINEFPALKDALELHSDPILRNRATLVGNLCTASPAADLAPALINQNAKIHTITPEKEKTKDIKNFFKGVKTNALEEDEVVTQVRIPKPHPKTKTSYKKWKRNEGEDLTVVGLATKISPENELKLTLSSVAPTPAQIPDTKNILKQNTTKEEKIQEAVKKVQQNISPITDARANAEYREHMAKVLTKRSLNQLLKEGE